LISALNSKDKNLVSVLKKWIERIEFSKDEKIEEITNIFNELRLNELTKVRIDNFFKSGLKYLNKITLEDYRKNELRNLIKELIEREK
jgi:geranylgeranyl diphosphate synthase type II